jgi:hypothetical protein
MAPRRQPPPASPAEALAALVDRLTDRRAAALDPGLLADLKSRCKVSGERER